MTTQDIFEASGTATPYLWSYQTVRRICEKHGQDPTEFYRNCPNVGSFIDRPGNVDAADLMKWLGY